MLESNVSPYGSVITQDRLALLSVEYWSVPASSALYARCAPRGWARTAIGCLPESCWCDCGSVAGSGLYRGDQFPRGSVVFCLPHCWSLSVGANADLAYALRGSCQSYRVYHDPGCVCFLYSGARLASCLTKCVDAHTRYVGASWQRRFWPRL